VATTTIRVSTRTHEALRALATATGEPIVRLVERAVERMRADEFFAEVDAAYGRLRAEPVAWADEVAERQAWDNALADGLDENEG
jgi:predicted transcriptional regulator